jgi:YidC/Oxa1 family membrane protein insertase
MDAIFKPFGILLRFFNSFTGSYAIALLLFALVVKVLLLPFAIKQQKNQIKGAKLRPKMLAIEKKYAGRNDQKTLRKKQEELMELQQKEGYSPLSGCLPLLIQLPIMIGLYNVIRKPLVHICQFSNDMILNLYNATVAPENAVNSIKNIDQIALISKLSDANGAYDSVYGGDLAAALPNFKLFGVIDLAAQPSFAWNWLLLIPLLSFIGAFVSMKLTKKLGGSAAQLAAAQTPDQKVSGGIMDWMMPIMSTWIAFIVPAALGLYWFFQSLLGIVQMLILAKVMPMPKYTKEELEQILKDMKRRQSSRPAYAGASSGDGTRPRSLHHIDDDDDELPPPPPKKKTGNQPKKNNAIAPAPLKDRENEQPKDAEPSETASAADASPESADSVAEEAPVENADNK